MQKEKIKVSGVKFDNIELTEAANKAIDLAKSNHQHILSTPNPEMLLESRNNPKFKNILNSSDINIPDGIGILWAAKFLRITNKNRSNIVKGLKWIFSLGTIIFYSKYIRGVLKNRVTGVDLMEKICEESAHEKLKIFLLGAREGIAEKTKEKLEKKYKSLKICGTLSGTPKEKDEFKIIKEINNSRPDILFVAYGAPAQEIWIRRNITKIPSVRLAVGVGGAFDFLSEHKKRAPRILQKIGMEWLYRLIKEPRRIKRIYNAIIKFPIQILKDGLK
ncbi:MAG: WecB/TagA/CpsF family glycosyltransferase [Candidatus Gracilibacteria bacterium]|jgi:N-acetylglucosaminyldiphosphoundecaprenol N-acetyl-beta-D-mannosaminyltransferase